MHSTSSTSFSPSAVSAEINLSYVWMIALVAALGGLLFGYDWVVIGGAKPFYEPYFHLTTETQVGWANSCALIGCFLGSLAGGRVSDHLGRKRVLLASAFIFTVSSLLTGWASHFSSFITWRIMGGVAIGLASNVSPTYIAEISPAQWRGRLVSLNQLALVIGILAAQIVNWLIARPVPDGLSQAAAFATWNVQYGWRWMFTAVAVPSLIFLVAVPLIPESPRWLVARRQDANARQVLAKIGGERYSQFELEGIQQSLAGSVKEVRWSAMLRGRIFTLLWIGIGLVVLQQGSGINVFFNYAEEVYRSAGYGTNEILFNIVITGTINLLFTLLAMTLVDRFDRRRLMILGSLGIGLCHVVAGAAYRLHLHGTWILLVTLAAIAFYAMTLAPVTWVLITEIFPNRYRGTAVSITVAALWIASFVLTYTFPILNRSVGSAGTFLFYSAICFAGAAFVFTYVPETRGKSLEAIEA
jgi:SP family xylose:H+ symportor-like MFS transporter